jgi:hypothetical protein
MSLKRTTKLVILAFAIAGSAITPIVLRVMRASDSLGQGGPVVTNANEEFAQPEEAARHRRAIMSGDARMLALVEEALARARSHAGVDPTYVRRLEQLRAERKARLVSYQDASSNR